jgi:methionine synthase II (cobalamin-independent)
VTTRQYDVLAELVDNGVHLLAGAESTAPIRALWRNLSHPPEMLTQRVTVTPACGLAGRSPDEARAALGRVRDVAKRLEEEQ